MMSGLKFALGRAAPNDAPVPGTKSASGGAAMHDAPMTAAKFAIGKTVMIDAPRSVGGRLAELKGTKGTVKSSIVTGQGRVYTIMLNDYAQGNKLKAVEVQEEYLARPGAVAQSTDVRFAPLVEVLKDCSVYRIPVFQRRYCWCPPQWKLFWKDVEKVRDNPDLNNHNLGRLMLLAEKEKCSRVVLDGQQRLTTVILLLAALCDRLSADGKDDVASKYRLLFGEGKLLPTMFDRADFVRCMAERRPAGDSSIVQAKCYFADLADTLQAEEIIRMVEAVLNRLSYTVFCVNSTAGMQSIFEKMAVRQQALDYAREMGADLFSCIQCYTAGEGGKQTKATHFGPEGERLCTECAKQVSTSCTPMTPGIPMSPVDVVRNFVFDHYETEADMLDAYKTRWGPMEERNGSATEEVEAALSTFLEAAGSPVLNRWDLVLFWLQVGTTAEWSKLVRRRLQ
eukprot:TRINITY_DN19279_c0_g1_i1.p1 TRINITY_DN19279_c0_g1~~TRINITY_DN19279_c0_g1_i1.p1  ORF type:complete len:453 (+),score=75.32 TRINITY_DN19279_c0_g1_i1:70-1428(+)